MPMSTTKVSTTLTEELVLEAKSRVGERGFSRYLDAALARQLQMDRLGDLERELGQEFGPIRAADRRLVDEMEWPI